MQGNAHVYVRDHINTDEIIPARYLNIDREAELAEHAMEDIDVNFIKKVKPGDFIVSGTTILVVAVPANMRFGRCVGPELKL